jgi:transposase
MDGTRLAARGQAPHGHWKATTFLVTLRHHRIEASWLYDGPIDGESFRTYVEKVVVPTLGPGDIVIMDNLGSQKRKAVRQFIRIVGAKLFLLPKCSPELNPIEQIFAKLRHLLREAAARSVGNYPRSNCPNARRIAYDECANYLQNFQVMRRTNCSHAWWRARSILRGCVPATRSRKSNET